MEPPDFNALWAPWRVQYFSAPRRPNFLLEAAQTTDDRGHLVLVRRRYCFLIMNAYPYAVGHLMAVPYREASDLADLSEGEWLELWELAMLAQRLLREAVGAEGFNVGLNLGACAGASMAKHLHLHIVPRWSGDNNFMAVLGGTRVLPEALESLYDRLAALFAQERL
ncbi:MAG: HIT domain-containing protein [Verrucomicrobia bacterium]|nr:HIT domain-containing protein [Verrucomicrobiota bacterium]